MYSTTPLSHIDVHLIEKALAFTGKTMVDMNEIYDIEFMRMPRSKKILPLYQSEFSIEKFYAYLLSPSFIEKYQNLQIVKWCIHYYVGEFGKAIYEHQKGNPETLLSLLEKI